MGLTSGRFVEKISLERIYRLLELAGLEFEKHPERSKKYVELAGKISERNKVKIPRELKKCFCSKCHAFLKAGKNSTIRVTKNWLNVSCKECNHVEKIGVKE